MTGFVCPVIFIYIALGYLPLARIRSTPDRRGRRLDDPQKPLAKDGLSWAPAPTKDGGEFEPNSATPSECPRQTQKGRQKASFALCLVTVLDNVVNFHQNHTVCRIYRAFRNLDISRVLCFHQVGVLFSASYKNGVRN